VEKIVINLKTKSILLKMTSSKSTKFGYFTSVGPFRS